MNKKQIKKIIYFGLAVILTISFKYFGNNINIPRDKIQVKNDSQTLLADNSEMILVVPKELNEKDIIEEALVVRIIDGDTIEIEGGEKVRYIGVNTLEMNSKNKSAQCFAFKAKEYNSQLVLNKKVKLVKDISDRDKYNRLLRYVYVGEKFVNDELVKNGYANVMTISPDVKFKDLFLSSQRYAKENDLGLWGECEE